MELFASLLLVIAVGMALIFLGVIMIMLSGIRGEGGKVEGGGVVLIGPLPIVFGTSVKLTKMLLILAIALTVMSIILFLVLQNLYAGVLGFAAD